jgi:ABC-type glycerol-3-phosphate transport system permease component
MAAALMSGVPVAILYALFIDHFVHGPTGTAAH